MAMTIVGLGTGRSEQLTLGAWRAMEQADTVFMRTAGIPPVSDLPEGPDYHVLSPASASDTAYQAAEIVTAARVQAVVYAVPGWLASERGFVEQLANLARAQGVAVRTIDGPAFLDNLLAALPDGRPAGLQLFSADVVDQMHYPQLNPAFPALIAGVHSVDLAGRLKTLLLMQYAPEHEVWLITPGQSGNTKLVAVVLGDLGRSEEFSPLAHLYVPRSDSLAGFESLQETMARLRAPGGCPWDREQDHQTLRSYLLEETYEVLDALDRNDLPALQEELGDLLLQIVFHAQVALDQGEFRMPDVIHHINSKLIHRHPHVWGDVDVNDSSDVTRNWEAIKKQERNDNGKSRASLLDGVSRALPALAQAYNYQSRAARVGFDWERIEPVIDKIREEIAEIRASLDAEHRAKEIGDLFFALVNWTRWEGIEPETALREANQRFYQRFHYIEQAAEQAGRVLAEMSLAEMDALWDEAKARGL
jgi:tetrapyrrole methylase family protein/MazG family protein